MALLTPELHGPYRENGMAWALLPSFRWNATTCDVTMTCSFPGGSHFVISVSYEPVTFVLLPM